MCHRPQTKQIVKTKGQTPRLCVLMLRIPSGGLLTNILNGDQRGLGIKRLYDFNIAVVAKYIWWLAHKKDHLWVKWVNGVYLRGTPWSDCRASSSATWAWRRICKVKDIMISGYDENWWLKEGKSYTVKQGYEWLCPVNVPVCWQHQLRMSKHGCGCDLLCCLCAASVESIQRLFFDCPYSSKCLQVVENKLGVHIPVSDFWKFVGAAICALIYRVWLARNHSLHNSVLVRAELWSKSLIPELIFRCKSVVTSNALMKHTQWLSSM
ncbi:hypothetical protein RND81_09G081400 [Saponaria officinalis]|uniref:Reverse transcriptase zinc-binding domain-containing protein n=1 Tax=Saponaria officinalis TaxID=3572 RepID=A0AAW1IJN7_SAPOF